MVSVIQRDRSASWRAKVQQAKRMVGAAKLRMGADLFEEAVEWTLAGIRHQNPHWSEPRCQQELRRRLSIIPSPSLTQTSGQSQPAA